MKFFSIFSELSQRPWEQQGSSPVGIPVETGLISPRAQTALVFIMMVVITVFFSLFLITLLARSQYPDFQALAGAAWQPFYHADRLWVSTGVLLCACIGLHVAQAIASKGSERARIVNLCLWAALGFSLLFVVAQLLLWRYLHQLGFYLADNPANSYFYLLTGLHGLHLMAGFLALLWVSRRVNREADWSVFSHQLKLCMWYWHYLFVLWMVLFFFAVSSPETYRWLAELCGY